PSESASFRDRTASRIRWTPVPVKMTAGCQGTRNPSEVSRRSPEGRGRTRVGIPGTMGGRLPVEAAPVVLHLGGQTGGGTFALLVTRAVKVRTASLPATSRARTWNVWTSFDRSKVS